MVSSFVFQIFSRKGNQSWGLRLVGGQDVGTLLKVEKVKYVIA